VSDDDGIRNAGGLAADDLGVVGCEEVGLVGREVNRVPPVALLLELADNPPPAVRAFDRCCG
jgi:hypothetical protein